MGAAKQRRASARCQFSSQDRAGGLFTSLGFKNQRPGSPDLMPVCTEFCSHPFGPSSVFGGGGESGTTDHSGGNVGPGRDDATNGGWCVAGRRVSPRVSCTQLCVLFYGARSLEMSHALPIRPTPFEELSEEEQIRYIETHLDEIATELRANPAVSPEDAERLADSLSRHRSQSEAGIPWEEVEKEFLKD